MRPVYSIGTLLVLTAVVAFAVAKQMSFLFFFFTIQFALVAIGVALLQHRIPQALIEASSDNCSRIDGSFSDRRHKKEKQARSKMRLDLLAVLLLVVLTGNWLAFFIHSEIIPIPLAFQSIGAFDTDADEWKQNLREQRIDEGYEQWAVSKTPATHEEIESLQKRLWFAWPIVVGIVVAWLVGSATFISRAYLKILREFASGVAARKQLNLNRDIAALQNDEIKS